jgi:DNA polymerase III epsilon subunit-like protein
MNKIFSFDAETNGLWGQAFCLGAVVYENGKEVKSWVGRCPIVNRVDKWVDLNVLSEIHNIDLTNVSYKSLLRDFAEFYLENKDGSDVIVHIGTPVESKIILDMHEFGFIDDGEAPFPLIDIAGNLQQAGFNPVSVDAYNAKHNIDIAGNAHNPLYDSRAAAECYISLTGGMKQ